MYIQINDGVAIFATHFIRCNPEGVRENLAPFQLEPSGIVVYLNDGITKAETILQEHEIPYIIEVLDYEQHKPKCQGIKYASRTEAMNHFLNDDEPESQIIPNLKKKFEEQKVRNNNLEEKILKIEEKLSKGGL